MSSPLGFLTGATYPFRALNVLRRSPQLWSYVLLPILLNLVLGGGLYFLLLRRGLQGITQLIAQLPEWALFLGWLLQGLLILGLLIFIGFVLLQFGVILGSPWYGKLSEELEQQRTGKPAAEIPGAVTSVVVDIWRSLLFEVKKLSLTVGVGLPLLLLNLFPGIGTAIATLGGLLLGATLVCLDFFDPALERRRLKFRTKLRVIRRSLPASASFGLLCLGLVSVPLLNLLAIPVCITAGTLFFCDRILPQPWWRELS